MAKEKIEEKLELIKKYADNLARERARFLFGSQYKGEAHCDETTDIKLLADQILELFKQEKEKLYDYCFKKCGEECEKAIKQRKENWRKELREKIEKLYVTKGVDYYSILDLLKDEK